MKFRPFLSLALLWLLPMMVFGDEASNQKPLDLTHSWVGFFSLGVVAVAYVAAMLEDVTFIRKSKPMLLGASLIWSAILLVYRLNGDTTLAVAAFRSNLESYVELLFFIMVSMTYLNVMESMKVFDALRIRLVSLQLGYRALFWLTGFLVFFISFLFSLFLFL